MAVQTDHIQSQYVDLGLLPQACIMVPETCACGATFSAWIQIRGCTPTGGVISSYYKLDVASFIIFCVSNGNNIA